MIKTHDLRERDREFRLQSNNFTQGKHFTMYAFYYLFRTVQEAEQSRANKNKIQH